MQNELWDNLENLNMGGLGWDECLVIFVNLVRRINGIENTLTIEMCNYLRVKCHAIWTLFKQKKFIN